MQNINDNKPRIILNEYKVTQNVPSSSTVFDEPFTIELFKKRFQIVIVRSENMEMEFDLIGTHPFLANTFRRLMLSDVPTMAIDKVHIYNNTSIIQDEVLAHRLGLIPLKADPRLFEFVNEDFEENDPNVLHFGLKIKCVWNKDENKESSRADDMYKNNNVYSKHLMWLPHSKQDKLFKKEDVKPIHDDILIAKMRPGHEMDIQLLAIKGIGRDHAKFSPVATAYYRLLPSIQITKDVEGEAAERFQKCFSPGVISLRNRSDGTKYAVVNDARYDMGSRNVYRYDDLKDTVIMSKIQDHFIFTVESVGALEPDVIFVEAIKVLKEKCCTLLEELNSEK